MRIDSEKRAYPKSWMSRRQFLKMSALVTASLLPSGCLPDSTPETLPQTASQIGVLLDEEMSLTVYVPSSPNDTVNFQKTLETNFSGDTQVWDTFDKNPHGTIRDFTSRHTNVFLQGEVDRLDNGEVTPLERKVKGVNELIAAKLHPSQKKIYIEARNSIPSATDTTSPQFHDSFFGIATDAREFEKLNGQTPFMAFSTEANTVNTISLLNTAVNDLRGGNNTHGVVLSQENQAKVIEKIHADLGQNPKVTRQNYITSVKSIYADNDFNPLSDIIAYRAHTQPWDRSNDEAINLPEGALLEIRGANYDIENKKFWALVNFGNTDEITTLIPKKNGANVAEIKGQADGGQNYWIDATYVLPEYSKSSQLPD